MNALLLPFLMHLMMGVDFQLKKPSITNGGGQSSSVNFKLNSSIGQKEASSEISSAHFKLSGGFWHTANNTDIIFKNGFEP